MKNGLNPDQVDEITKQLLELIPKKLIPSIAKHIVKHDLTDVTALDKSISPREWDKAIIESAIMDIVFDYVVEEE